MERYLGNRNENIRKVWQDILETETEAQGKYGKISWKQKRKHKESMERYLGTETKAQGKYGKTS